LQVRAHLAELRHEIALADDLAVAILGHLSGQIERAAAARRRAVSEPHGLHELRRVEEVDLARHTILLRGVTSCRRARSLRRSSSRRGAAWPRPRPPRRAR